MRSIGIIVLLVLIVASLFLPDFTSSSGFVLKEHGFYIFNVLLLAAILYKAGNKPIKTFLVERRNVIEEELKEAARLQEAASARLTEYEAKLKNLASEQAQIQQAFIDDGEREKSRIIAEAEAAATKMIADTERQIEMEGKKIVIALEEEAVNMAIAMAEQAAKGRMNDELQAALVSNATASIEALPANELAESNAGGGA